MKVIGQQGSENRRRKKTTSMQEGERDVDDVKIMMKVVKVFRPQENMLEYMSL